MNKSSKSSKMKKQKSNKNILEMSFSEARKFLLEGGNYCRFDLPKYFKFDGIIKKLSKSLDGKDLKEFCRVVPKLNEKNEIQLDAQGNEKTCLDLPRNYDDVNYKLINNSILMDITFKNPRTYPVSSAIFSKLINYLESNEDKLEIIEKIRTRFKKIPNTGHLEIWLQRITYKIDGDIKYNEKLCRLVMGGHVDIWNLKWLNDKLKKLIKSEEIVARKLLDCINPVIKVEEVELFREYT